MSWKACKRLRILPEYYPDTTIAFTSVANVIAVPVAASLTLGKQMVV